MTQSALVTSGPQISKRISTSSNETNRKWSTMPRQRRRDKPDTNDRSRREAAEELRRSSAVAPVEGPAEGPADAIDATTATNEGAGTDALADRIERALGIADREIDLEEVVLASRLPAERVSELRRAMGLPEPESSDRVFSRTDVAMLRSISDVIDSGVVTYEEVLAISRLSGTALAHVAEAQLDAFMGSSLWAHLVSGQALGPPDGGRDAPAGHDPLDALDPDLLEDVVRALVPALEQSLVYVWRRHMAAITRRMFAARLLDDAPTSIGFVDLVGYTERSRRSSTDEIDELLREFDRISYESVALGGGRVIKMIGDEVMFEAPNIADACKIALALQATASQNDRLGLTRAAVASGAIVSRSGDRFGPAVNLASRLTAAAFPGSLLVPSSAAAALADHPDMDCRSVRSPLHLKGIGSVRCSVVRPRTGPRSEPSGPGADLGSDGGEFSTMGQPDPAT